jgi:hypothetical protein
LLSFLLGPKSIPFMHIVVVLHLFSSSATYRAHGVTKPAAERIEFCIDFILCFRTRLPLSHSLLNSRLQLYLACRSRCTLSASVSRRVASQGSQNIRTYPFEHQLRNPVSVLDLEVCLSVVEQQDFDLTSVVCVNHSSTSIDEAFRRKTGPRRYSSIYGRISISNRTPVSAYLIHVPSGTAMARSVSTNVFPLAGTTVSCAE